MMQKGMPEFYGKKILRITSVTLLFCLKGSMGT